MIDKFCIIIDDEDQNEIVENLREDAAKQGIRLNCFQMNPQSEAYYKNKGTPERPDYVIDLDKVSSDLLTPAYRKLKVDIIACDYDLQDDEVNGYTLIGKLRGHLKYQKEIILYSANLDRVVNAILKVDNPKELYTQVRHLAHARIRDFHDKNDYRQSIITALKDTTFSLESELETLLTKYADLTFNSVFPPLRGKKIAEILGEIEAGSKEGKGFQKALLENAIAHMVEMNTDE